MSYENLTEIIRTRRSVFPNMYLDKEISNDTILDILENANWAPNHKKTEPWRFKIFKGESRNDLSEYLGAYYKSHVDSDKFSEMKYKKTLKKPLQSSCVIALCMYNDPSISIPEWEELAAVSCAIQNMWLSCTALGIGSYWSSPKSILNANEFLRLGEFEKCIGLFYMGYYENDNLKSTRNPIEDKVIWM